MCWNLLYICDWPVKELAYAIICKGLAFVEGMGSSQALWQRGGGNKAAASVPAR